MTTSKPASESDRRRTSGADNRISESEAYEVRYFAEKNGISMDQARRLISRRGSGSVPREDDTCGPKGH